MSEHSQRAQTLHLLRMGRKLTPMAALRLYGCFRLAARVWELRREGHKIEGQMLIIGKKRIYQYWLA